MTLLLLSTRIWPSPQVAILDYDLLLDNEMRRPREPHPRLSHQRMTDEELLSCVAVLLSRDDWARLAVLAADQADLSPGRQDQLAEWLRAAAGPTGEEG